MKRKRITFWLCLFLALPTLASAQQVTKADIQVLESKITNLETTVREMDKRLTAQIQAVQTTLQTTITEMDKRLTAQMQAVQTTMAEMDKRVTTQINVLFWAIGALIALVLAVIALPQLLGYFQEKRARTDFQKMIDELNQRVEQQQQEIDELKSRRLVTPS
jgi:beta-lactamase regulating signal transducer with metallopeptidase domain